ncbi:MAG: hypothetical protein INF84_20755 [Roseomonas sp.]|nr:hypothetical protein [Roseomonas sp.]
MSSSIPIIILSFNRPGLLEAVLVSLTKQGRPIDPKNVYLFQDGGSDLQDECIDVFKKVIPEGTVMASDTNLGIGLNFDRAERFAFESLGAEVAYFFEDDLVLGEHYLQVMDQLCAFALSEPRVGYFAAQGNHLAGLDKQKARSTEVIPMFNNWGFGLTKRQWARQREIIEPFLDIIRRDTYRRRDHKAIRDYYNKLGYQSATTSQDGAKDIAGLVLGTTKIMSFACFARYEGRQGVHATPASYDQGRFADTQLYPELPTLVMPSPAVLDQWIEAGRRRDKVAYVAAKPHMDDEGFQCFSENISGIQCYLEYGCGGSTVYAAEVAKVPSIIAVDSSQEWVDRVTSSIQGSEGRFFIEHCDLGPTGDWGVPNSDEKRKFFWRYVVMPWNTAKQHSLTPELVLIDGRFRIASFLFSLLSAPEGTTILFNDYFDRPHYAVVEEFCRVDQRRGRMAVFKTTRSFSHTDLATKLMIHSLDWS